MNISVFTEIVLKIAHYSELIENMQISHDDFVEYQKLETRIINARETRHITHAQYKPLIHIYYLLLTDFRNALKYI